MSTPEQPATAMAATDHYRRTGDNVLSLALTSKLDMIMAKLQKLGVLDQLVVQVANITKSMAHCNASVAELKQNPNK